MSNLTSYIETAQTVLDALAEELVGADESWTVEVFGGTGYQRLFEFLPGVQLPCAVLVWQSAALNREPARPQRIYHTITVLVLTNDADSVEGHDTARRMAWSVMDVLDDWQSGDMLCRVQDIAAVDLETVQNAPNVSCYAITVEVGDH